MAILLTEWTELLPTSLIFPLVGEVVRFRTGCDVIYRWNMGIQKKCQALSECSPPPLGLASESWFACNLTRRSWRRENLDHKILPFVSVSIFGLAHRTTEPHPDEKSVQCHTRGIVSHICAKIVHFVIKAPELVWIAELTYFSISDDEPPLKIMYGCD